MSLTQIQIDKLKPGDKFREVPDGNGLYVGVGTTGAKSFIVRFRFEGKPRKLTLGKYPQLGLAAARRAAATALFEVSQGRDPTAPKRAAKASQAVTGNVESILEDYIVKSASQKRAGKEIARMLRKELVSWHGRQLTSINKKDIHEVLDGIVSRGSLITANRCLSYMRLLFAWSLQRGLIDADPSQGIRAPSNENRRERFLTLDETRRVYRAADKLGHPFGPIVKLLVLTGQRLREIAHLRWSEIADNAIHLPRERSKNKRPHVIYLAPAAREIITAAPRIIGTDGQPSDYVFTFSGKPIGGFDPVKRKLDTLLAADGGDPLEPFVFHDLRRTAATGMARLGVDIHVIERCLNHTSGVFAGIVSIYQKHDYAPECREAWEKWAASVTKTDA